MRRLLLPMLALAGCAMPVHAGELGNDAESEKAAPVVVVSSVRDPEIKSYRSMLKGVDAFQSFSALAPRAELRFLLVLPPGAAGELSLRVADADKSVDVPVRQDRTFTLPILPAFDNADAELLLNVKKGQARWRPLVRTPGLAPDTRRLGDLRLECEVRWSAELHNISPSQRRFYRSLGGPCHSNRVPVYFPAPRALASATLVEGERRLELPLLNGGRSYIAPLHDASFDNEALIQLVYRDAAQSSSQIK